MGIIVKYLTYLFLENRFFLSYLITVALEIFITIIKMNKTILNCFANLIDFRFIEFIFVWYFDIDIIMSGSSFACYDTTPAYRCFSRYSVLTRMVTKININFTSLH